MSNTGAVVSYSGVHQAFQLALAAQEIGCLDTFYCSLIDAPGKLGRSAAMLFGQEALINRRCVGLDVNRVVEIPWPEIMGRLFGRSRMIGQSPVWIRVARSFDCRVATLLMGMDARVFVGVENCCRESFRVAKRLGMHLFYDCPGFNPELSYEYARAAAEHLGIEMPKPADSAFVKANKDEELSMADNVFVYSAIHRISWERRGVKPEKFIETPLWIDSSTWYPGRRGYPQDSVLRVLFVGRATLLKGFPYLIGALRKIGKSAQLTVVGDVSDEMLPFLRRMPSVTRFPATTKNRLRGYYRSHDVLVLPSLGDSFGFVALEAMACGIPVIVTDNCGVPVPDKDWRVPVMDCDAIANRLQVYLENGELKEEDGQRAALFAQQFTPERYRRQIQTAYKAAFAKF